MSPHRQDRVPSWNVSDTILYITPAGRRCRRAYWGVAQPKPNDCPDYSERPKRHYSETNKAVKQYFCMISAPLEVFVFDLLAVAVNCC